MPSVPDACPLISSEKAPPRTGVFPTRSTNDENGMQVRIPVQPPLKLRLR